MIKILRILFSILFIYMVYTVISTSLKSNLFDEWSALADIPWLTATLIDFYVNTVVISVWVLYKEVKLLNGIIWVISFVLLGSIATTFYLLVKLFKLNPDDSLDRLFIKDRPSGGNL